MGDEIVRMNVSVSVIFIICRWNVLAGLGAPGEVGVEAKGEGVTRRKARFCPKIHFETEQMQYAHESSKVKWLRMRMR